MSFLLVFPIREVFILLLDTVIEKTFPDKARVLLPLPVLC